MSACECEVRGRHSARHHEMVLRQAQAWMLNDFGEAAKDWHPDGRLTAPRGVVVRTADIAGVVQEWHQMFIDLDVQLISIADSTDGSWVVIEWTWSVTRKADGRSSTTKIMSTQRFRPITNCRLSS